MHPRATIQRARQLRRDSSFTEIRLWLRLRDRQLGGYKFRRQHPIGPYFADFACLNPRLVVEVDGDDHALRAPGRDIARDTFLNSQGFTVARFWVAQIDKDMQAVLDTIWELLTDPNAQSIEAGDFQGRISYPTRCPAHRR